MVSHAFGHLPERNESIVINNIEFKVINADNRRLVQLRVKLPDPNISEEFDD